MTTTKSNLFSGQATSAQIATALVGKTVRYIANNSKVTKNRVRIFKIEGVENVDFSVKTGERFVTVLAKDFDDGAVSKYRNLHLAGIDLIG
jgi:hypothetical protein